MFSNLHYIFHEYSQTNQKRAFTKTPELRQ